jgi:hypothetical protein
MDVVLSTIGLMLGILAAAGFVSVFGKDGQSYSKTMSWIALGVAVLVMFLVYYAFDAMGLYSS